MRKNSPNPPPGARDRKGSGVQNLRTLMGAHNILGTWPSLKKKASFKMMTASNQVLVNSPLPLSHFPGANVAQVAQLRAHNSCAPFLQLCASVVEICDALDDHPTRSLIPRKSLHICNELVVRAAAPSSIICHLTGTRIQTSEFNSGTWMKMHSAGPVSKL